jgi:hypothetical protein
VVIERSEKALTMDRVVVPESKISDWKLSLIAGLDYRSRDRGKLKQDKCQYLQLKFPNGPQRQTFVDELEAVMKEYRETQEAIDVLRTRIQCQAGKPRSKKTQGLNFDNMSLETLDGG